MPDNQVENPNGQVANAGRTQDREGYLPRESPILNHRLRDEGETFWDAMRQGEAALYGERGTKMQTKAR